MLVVSVTIIGGPIPSCVFCVSRCRCIHVDVNVSASIVVLLEYCVSCRCVVLTGRVMCVCLYSLLVILVVRRCSMILSLCAESVVHVLCGREHRFVGEMLAYRRCLILN
jgi:hypothetical protein